MQGQIVKVISDQFFVDLENEVIVCKQRGKLKNLKTLPLVGDFVLIDKEKKVILEILPRKNEIIRPNVSNIDQALVVTSLKNPDFSTNLLDKLLVQLEINNIKPIICLTKKDLLKKSEFELLESTIAYYKKIGYLVVENTEILKIKKYLVSKVTVLIGQTGAGKSTLLNNLFKDLNLKTGEVSLALGRGRHTTRHVEIIKKGLIKVLDTPGFSALSFADYTPMMVRDAFIEFKNFPCPYKDCMHLKEGECKVKEAVSKKEIIESRYLNYKNFQEEFKTSKRW